MMAGYVLVRVRACLITCTRSITAVLEEFSGLKVGDSAQSLWFLGLSRTGATWKNLSIFWVNHLITCIWVFLSLSNITGVVSRLGGNHGEAVAVCDAGSCHGGACTDLPKALRVSDPFPQPGYPLCQEGSAFCAAEHWQAYSGATAGWQLCHEVRFPSVLLLHGFAWHPQTQPLCPISGVSESSPWWL